jgi:hypothetical protein
MPATYDYARVSECLLPKVNFFSVHNVLPDHCQISLMMRINCTLTPDDNQTYPLPVRYKWTENSPFLFQEALSKPNSQTNIESINTNYENVDCLVGDINLVLCNAANAALSKSCNKPKKNTTKPPKWYDQTLDTLKKNLIQKQKLFEKNSRDPFVMGSLFSALKMYRKVRKRKIRDF